MEAVNSELLDPVTGECIDLSDPDAIIDAWEATSRALETLHSYKSALTKRLDEMAQAGDGKTKRLRGQRRQVKIVAADDSYNQSILKEAYHAYPAFRDEFLRIDSLALKLREWKKAVGTTGPADFESFKSLITSASRGPTHAPRIHIEE